MGMLIARRAALAPLLALLAATLVACSGADAGSADQITKQPSTTPRATLEDATSVADIIDLVARGQPSVCIQMMGAQVLGSPQPLDPDVLDPVPPELETALLNTGLTGSDLEIRKVFADSVLLGSLDPPQASPSEEHGGWLAAAVRLQLFDDWVVVESGRVYECDL